MGALLAARFGANGGSETQRSMFRDALQNKLGPITGRRVFDDLRSANDVEAPVMLARELSLPPAARLFRGQRRRRRWQLHSGRDLRRHEG